MSGIAMSMIEESMVASSTPTVVLVSATHLYRSPGAAAATGSRAPPACTLIVTLCPPALAVRPR